MRRLFSDCGIFFVPLVLCALLSVSCVRVNDTLDVCPETENQEESFLRVNLIPFSPNLTLRGDSEDRRIKEIQDLIISDIQTISVLFYQKDSQNNQYKLVNVNHSTFSVVKEGDSLFSSVIQSAEKRDGHFSIKLSPIKLQKGEYRMFIIINAVPRVLECLKNITDLSDFQHPFMLAENTKKYNFDFLSYNMFTPLGGVVNISPENFYNQNEKESDGKSIEIQMIPTNAFYTLTMDESCKTDKLGEEIHVYPDVVNKKVRLCISEPISPILDGVDIGSFTWPKPCYDSTLDLQDFSKDHFYINQFKTMDKALKPLVYNLSDINNDKTYGIIPENTLYGPKYSGLYVTGLFLKLKYFPKNIEKGHTWVRFNNKVLNEGEYRALCQKVEQVDVELSHYEQAFKLVYNEVKAAYNSGDEQKNINPILEYFKTYLRDVLELKAGFSYKGLDIYFQGENYYYVPLVHKYFIDEETNAINPLYGTVRNTLYNINIKSVSKAGYGGSMGIDRLIDYSKIKYSNNLINISAPDVRDIEVDL